MHVTGCELARFKVFKGPRRSWYPFHPPKKPTPKFIAHRVLQGAIHRHTRLIHASVLSWLRHGGWHIRGQFPPHAAASPAKGSEGQEGAMADSVMRGESTESILRCFGLKTARILCLKLLGMKRKSAMLIVFRGLIRIKVPQKVLQPLRFRQPPRCLGQRVNGKLHSHRMRPSYGCY